MEAPFPASAMQPKTAISPAPTGCGTASRRIASTRMNAAMPNSSRALAVAARISSRAYPKVRRSVAGLLAKCAASRDRPTPAASAAMCPASASSTREPDTAAPMTSPAAMTTVMPRTTASVPR